FDRRAVCLVIEGSFENSVKFYEQEIEHCINEGRMPAAGYTRLLRTIASVRGGPAADRASRRAQGLLQKYFSPEGQEAVRERVRTAPKPDRAVLRVRRARLRQLRRQKLVEHFEEIGGAILLEAEQVCYFIPKETQLSRALVTKLSKCREELKQ